MIPFDPFDPHFKANAHAWYAQLRPEHPIAKVSKPKSTVASSDEVVYLALEGKTTLLPNTTNPT
jgi:hypothetical protein